MAKKKSNTTRCYPSAFKLADAFRDQLVTGSCYTLQGKIMADENNIWNGPKLHLLVTRNHSLNKVVALAEDSASLGSSANAMITRALEKPAKYSYHYDGDGRHYTRKLVQRASQPVPVARVDRVREDHAHCDLATLQHDVLESVTRRMEQVLSRLSKPKSYATTSGWNAQAWDQLESELAVVGLKTPEHLNTRRVVIRAKQRLVE